MAGIYCLSQNYRDFLSDRQIAAIQSLEIKKGEYSEVFYMQNEKRSLLRVRPDSLAYLICTSDGNDKAMTEEMRAINPALSRIKLLKMLANRDRIKN
ncbi:MAG: hypothetical protein JNL11_10850 [Bdellovibrionaceae bacterium]|nr:hypothetical protein [Pseudobdellovibrionaceae bacterium]